MDCFTLGCLLELPPDLAERGWGLVMCRTPDDATPSHPWPYLLLYSRWLAGEEGGRPDGAGRSGRRLDAAARSDHSWADARQQAIVAMRLLDARHDPPIEPIEDISFPAPQRRSSTEVAVG
jgi:hypothetical protein